MLVSVPLVEELILSAEAIGRIAADDRTSQLETRVQIGHAVGKRVTGWIGWVHFENYVPHAPNGREDQIVEQVNWAIGRLGGVRLSTRARLEQRFVRGIDGTSWRWRQQLRGAVPLGPKNAPSVAVWAEPYIALNRTGAQRRTLDQLRLFAGLSVPLTRQMDIEVGYLNQRLYRAAPTLVNHAIPVNLTVRF